MTINLTAYQEGRVAAQKYPARLEGGRYHRPFGFNPYEFFSENYHEWNRGYEEYAAEKVRQVVV